MENTKDEKVDYLKEFVFFKSRSGGGHGRIQLGLHRELITMINFVTRMAVYERENVISSTNDCHKKRFFSRLKYRGLKWDNSFQL